MAPLLEVSQIQTYIGQYHILSGVTLQVEQGTITALLGRNGAGKTTTLKSILGLTPPRSGEIRLAGERISGRRTFRIAQCGIGYVPEHRAIFRHLTVHENLQLAERRRGDLRRKAELIYSLFPDLQRLSRLKGGQLSGGQQQMLAIARALVPDNQMLLIDEPSEGLAPVVIEQMMAAIRHLSAHTTVLLVEQNFRMASAISERYFIVDDGRTVHAGEMAALKADKTLIHTYLGAA
ncbi:MAG TPA: ABC transporter ATP-binding protein [Herpetosiphonaceae bacterium]|nr:ABC transporter ATP-binding protein [Herpetosiphonaceae bacterium]